ncbi:MAG TPA: BTAD domain-containing putative transcriptional regulator [Actinophytocola sp.]|uniref:AfsR/SARP family transcriptional regulator n=1 Tax=Actinophytocola sp. TaxID=1872138 RepID=UPI002DBEE1F1|nr:BTAD domain-containing putative transcriptional regulator [Actinophytocola sp.]HEU5472929.1 BTAD domain-containing putative transcriptional regulator [Actinophytocola sp.]
MAVQFRLLGDIDARVDDQPITIGYAQLRCMLVVLLIEANRTVPVDTIVARVWGDRRVPHRPRGAVQHDMTLLRRALRPAGDVRITWRSTGYQLTVDPDAVDVYRFRALIRLARSAADDERAAELFEQALALWRGDPLADLDTPWINSVRATLTQQYHSAQLDLTDLRLRAGQHTTLLAELAERVEQQPLDERLNGQYMLTLYRNGRQASALEHYRRLWQRLAKELGTEPSPPLRRLHHRILTADPVLDTAADRAARPVVPRQLPSAPRLFTGRGHELAMLTETLTAHRETAGICAIGGIGGIGKTWLALHWAHHHLDRFPDGQLHVNLRGFDPSGEPMTAVTAVRGFLDALGADPATVPPDPQAQLGLYRSLLAGRRMLILLDNARDSGQVIPLLPGSPTCAVLVTSRRRLTGLITAQCAHSLTLDVLTETDAHSLIARHLGVQRLAAEPRAVADLLSHCAGLPLALGIVAARATSHPGFPLAALADELHDHTDRLDALDAGDTPANLRAVFSWSRHALSNEAAAVFRLLALAPGPDIGLPAAANLTGLPIARTRTLLRELSGSHLIGQHGPGRYRMHDLIRLYATDQTRHEPTDTAALRRLVDFYLHTAAAAERLLGSYRPPIPIGAPEPGCRPHLLHDDTSALAWFTAEHPNLLAAQRISQEHGWHAQVWQLAWALDIYHYRRGRLADGLTVWQAAQAAAERLGDRATQTLAHRRLGYACARVGRHAEARQHLRQALRLAEATNDLRAQAHTHYVLAQALAQHGNDRQALEHALNTLRLYRTLDMPARQARALDLAGRCHTRLGDHDQARSHCEAALDLFRQHHDRDGEASTLDNLGQIAHRTSDHDLAQNYYNQALTLLRELGNTYHEAETLEHIGLTQQHLGQLTAAHASWHQARTLYQSQHRTDDADRVGRLLTACDRSGA